MEPVHLVLQRVGHHLNVRDPGSYSESILDSNSFKRKDYKILHSLYKLTYQSSVWMKCSELFNEI